MVSSNTVLFKCVPISPCEVIYERYANARMLFYCTSWQKQNAEIRVKHDQLVIMEMMKVKHRLRSIGTIRWGRNVLEFLPLRVLVWLPIILACPLLFLWSFDRTLVWAQEGGTLYQSLDWDEEDKRIWKNLESRVKCDPLLRLGHWEKVPRTKTKKRILVIGDSYAYGDGLSNINDTYWMQLRRILFERGYRDIELIAVGECGWTTRNELNKARQVFPIYKPDIVIWMYITNDPDEETYKQAENEEAWKDYYSSLIKGDFWYEQCVLLDSWFPHLSAVLRKHRHEALVSRCPPPDELGYQYCSWKYMLHSPENIERYDLTLSQVAKFIKDSKVPHIFITQKAPLGSDESYFINTVRGLFDKHNITFIDLGAELIDYHLRHSGSLPNFNANPSNGHNGLFASRPLAEMTLSLLEKEYSQLLPKQTKPFKPLEINDWVPHDLEVLKSSKKTFVFGYPDETNKYMLRMPFNEPYVQLNFEFPLELSSITINGNNLVDSRLDFTVESLRDEQVYRLGVKSGSSQKWDIPNDLKESRIRTLRFSTKFGNVNGGRVIELSFEQPEEKSIQP